MPRPFSSGDAQFFWEESLHLASVREQQLRERPAVPPVDTKRFPLAETRILVRVLSKADERFVRVRGQYVARHPRVEYAIEGAYRFSFLLQRHAWKRLRAANRKRTPYDQALAAAGRSLIAIWMMWAAVLCFRLGIGFSAALSRRAYSRAVAVLRPDILIAFPKPNPPVLPLPG